MVPAWVNDDRLSSERESASGDGIGATTPISLRRNVYWIGAGNVVRGAAQWGMIAILAKAGSPQMVGQYALGLAITAPVMLLAGLQLNAIQITDASGEFSFRDYFSLRAFTTLFALAAVAIIALASGFQRETALVIVLVALSKAADAVGDIFLSAWQQREHMSLVASMWMINAVSSLALFSAGVAWKGSVVWAAVGSVGGSVVALCLVALVARPVVAGPGRRETFWFDLKVWRRLIPVALPLGAVGVLLSLNVNIPRYFIQLYLGESALGLFAAAAYPMVAGDTLVNSIAQSVLPRLSRYYAVGDGEGFRRLLARVTAIGVLTGCAALAVARIAGREIMTWLYRPEYGAQATVFVWIVAAVSIRYCYVFIGVAVTAMRCFVVQLYLRLAVLVCLLAMAPVLILRFGLIGGAGALVLVNSLEGAAWLAIGYALIWRQSKGLPEGLFRAVERLPGEV